MSCEDYDIKIKKGSTYPPIRCRLNENDSSRLSSTQRDSIESATFKMVDFRTGAVKISETAATVINGELIDIQYQQEASDVDTAGKYKFEFTVNYTGGYSEPFPGEGTGILVIEDTI